MSVPNSVTNTTIPESLRSEYPFKSNFFKLKEGNVIHYVDEGPRDSQHPPIIMVHGNPTWSFFYRNIIKELSKTRRVIAADHLGCGLSSKPQEYNYTLENHVNNLSELFRATLLPQLGENQTFDLMVHDWGGAIGMGLACRFKEKLGRSVIMNTAAYTDEQIPKRIALCKIPILGERLVRHFNAFAWPATFMAVEKPLSSTIKKGYLLPYDNYKNRIATARFVKDIPMTKSHPTWKTLKEIEDQLKDLPGDKLLLWGEKDFCFSPHFFERWKDFYPKAKAHLLANAGHYLLEDEPEVTRTHITEFLQ
jgi:pimeloyl-ACP methyl ester carboxylesterase